MFSSVRGFHIYILHPTTPPGLGSSIFLSTTIKSKIYVPDASLTAYKTNGSWSEFAARIYPMSDLNGKILNRELL